MRDTKYLSLDLELDRGDIIELGVVLGCPGESPDHWIRKSWLLHPRHGQPLEQRITELTGITQSELDGKAVSHGTVKSELTDLIEQHKPFVNPVQWGVSDSVELLAEFDDMTGSRPPIFGRRFIDVKHFFLFIEAANGRALSGGLSHAMGRYGLRFEGRKHRAGDDAFNTLRLFFHLLERQSTLESAVQSFKSL